MARQIILAFVIVVCLAFALWITEKGPFGALVKWALEAFEVAIAILGILWIFGIVS